MPIYKSHANLRIANQRIRIIRNWHNWHTIRISLASRGGFTLIETLVALTLIVSAMVGPFTLATSGIFNAKFSKSKLTALNLTQEGIEIIRQMRENNVLKGFDWRGSGCTAGLTPGCTKLQDGSYQPDVFTTADGSTPPINSNAPLRFDASVPLTDAASLYNQSFGQAVSPFTRVVTISTPAANQMQVVSVISWTESSIPRQVHLEEVMYNWR